LLKKAVIKRASVGGDLSQSFRDTIIGTDHDNPNAESLLDDPDWVDEVRVVRDE
jgi:hypothetical protein